MDQAIYFNKCNCNANKIEAENKVVRIQVHQVVKDLNQHLLADEIVEHSFHLKNNKIAGFEIGEKLDKTIKRAPGGDGLHHVPGFEMLAVCK